MQLAQSNRPFVHCPTSFIMPWFDKKSHQQITYFLYKSNTACVPIQKFAGYQMTTALHLTSFLKRSYEIIGQFTKLGGFWMSSC